MLAISLVQRLGERRRLERSEDAVIAHDLGYLNAELRQRCGHLEADETAADDHGAARLGGPAPELERVVERAQRQGAVEWPRPRAGGDHDRLGVEFVE